MCDLSVILSTRNRERLLEQTLAGLAGQIVGDLRWEVIVIDNGSTDGTAEVLRRWEKNIPLRALRQPVPGKNRALNLALPVAAGEQFVFTDDDIIPEPHWLRQLYDGARRWPDDIVFGGRIVPRFPDQTPAFLKSEDFRYSAIMYSRFEPQSVDGPVSVEPFGPNLMIHRSAFESFRYTEQFSPALGSYSAGSETELLIRLRNAGRRFIYLREALVEHVIEPHQLKLRWLLERAMRFGRTGARMPDRGSAAECFSVPRYLWRRLAECGAAAAVDSIRWRKRRWEALIALWHVVGSIREYRAMAIEGRPDRHEPSALGVNTKAVNS